MLYIVIAVVLVLWLLGLMNDVAGGFINVLLVVAAFILIIDLIGRRRP